MTNFDKLFEYRWDQANTTLRDAQLMLQQEVSYRSIVNRAYYAVFYAVLAFFLKTGRQINTSKHTGIIGIFDKEFIINNEIEKEFSKIFHSLFEDRQEFDYKDFTEVIKQDAEIAIMNAQKFLNRIHSYLNKSE